MNLRDKNIVPINTNNPILARMSWLIKTSKNPDGIEGVKLMKMSDEEIITAYDKWSETNKKCQ
jgi:hypothetical protein|tara:strand:- start:2149 stop:2337 length:189 start_codon:yes stop_codon:yes gene_type:complete